MPMTVWDKTCVASIVSNAYVTVCIRSLYEKKLKEKQRNLGLCSRRWRCSQKETYRPCDSTCAKLFVISIFRTNLIPTQGAYPRLTK
jgi:hypothetical protein